MLPPFSPEPYVDFNKEGPRQKMLAALANVSDQLGQSYPIWINGEPVTTGETFGSLIRMSGRLLLPFRTPVFSEHTTFADFQT